MEAFFGCHVWPRVHMDAVGAGPVTKNIARAKMDQNCKRGSSANDRRDSRAGFEATYGSW